MSNNIEAFKKELYEIRKEIESYSIGQFNRTATIKLYSGEEISVTGKECVKYLAIVFSVR